MITKMLTGWMMYQIQLVTGSQPAGAADMNQAPMNFIKEGQHERD